MQTNLCLNKKTECKFTRFGSVPNGWKVLKLKDFLISARLGGNYSNTNEVTPYPLIKMGNIGRGVVDATSLQYIPSHEEICLDDKLSEGDLLFNTRNTLELVGKVAIWRNEVPAAFYNSNLLRLVFNPNVIWSNYFMNYAFNSDYAIKQLRGFATGTTSVAAIYSRDLNNTIFFIPPLDEQHKIIELLSTWDNAIEKLQQLIAAKQKHKKALMQQLLTGKKRFKEFVKEESYNKTKFGLYPKDWDYIQLEEVAKEVSVKNKEGDNLPVLSCTKYQGLVDSLKYFGKQIFSKDTSTYKVVKRGQFAYATNHIEEGSIGYQNLHDAALISPMYTAFVTNSRVNDDFLYRLLKTDLYIHIYQSSTSASVDRRGSLRWKEFSKIRIPLPSINEQNKITTFLQTADKELEALQQKLNALKQQKKGLMQKLLTGQVRVNRTTEPVS